MKWLKVFLLYLSFTMKQRSNLLLSCSIALVLSALGHYWLPSCLICMCNTGWDPLCSLTYYRVFLLPVMPSHYTRFYFIGRNILFLIEINCFFDCYVMLVSNQMVYFVLGWGVFSWLCHFIAHSGEIGHLVPVMHFIAHHVLLSEQIYSLADSSFFFDTVFIPIDH